MNVWFYVALVVNLALKWTDAKISGVRYSEDNHANMADDWKKMQINTLNVQMW